MHDWPYPAASSQKPLQHTTYQAFFRAFWSSFSSLRSTPLTVLLPRDNFG